jgi:hypothetical protein
MHVGLYRANWRPGRALRFAIYQLKPIERWRWNAGARFCFANVCNWFRHNRIYRRRERLNNQLLKLFRYGYQRQLHAVGESNVLAVNIDGRVLRHGGLMIHYKLNKSRRLPCCRVVIPRVLSPPIACQCGGQSIRQAIEHCPHRGPATGDVIKTRCPGNDDQPVYHCDVVGRCVKHAVENRPRDVAVCIACDVARTESKNA